MSKGFGLLWVIVGVLVITLAGLVFYFIRGASVRQNVAAAEPTAAVNVKVCDQVITYAENLQTGECKSFKSVCDLSEGWKVVDGCLVLDISKWQSYAPSSRAFELLYPEGWVTTVRQTTVSALNGERLITQVQFDVDDPIRRGPQGFLYGRIELSWIGNPAFSEVSADEFVKDYFARGNPSFGSKKYGELDVLVVKHSMCPGNGGCLDYVVKNGPYFYDLRVLNQPVSEEDRRIAEEMLKSWKFSN